MKKLILVSPLFVILCFSSCRKEIDANSLLVNDIETIYPKSYLPLYPGSSWTYRIREKHFSAIITATDTIYTFLGQDTSYVTYTTAPEYMLHSYIVAAGSDYQEYSEEVYVPFYNGEPMYGYHRIDYKTRPPFGYPTYKQYPLLSEEVGYEFISEKNGDQYGFYGTYNIVWDKYETALGDSVIVTYGHYDMFGDPNKRIKREWWHYYKDIGLKLHYSYNVSIEDSTYVQELIDYSIND